MLEWFSEALQAFDDRMTRGGDVGLIRLMLVTMVGIPLLVFLHELGHALACVLLRVPVRRLRVGGDPQVTIGRGAFRLELSLREGTGAAGFVEWGGAPTSWKVALIALGGPALHAAATVALFAAADGAGPLGDALWLLGALSAVSLAFNLVPWGLPAGPERWNDGCIVLAATLFALMRADPVAREPLPASVPPPAPDIAAPVAPAIRRPFAVLLGAAAILALLVSPLMALALALLFGYVLLTQS